MHQYIINTFYKISLYVINQTKIILSYLDIFVGLKNEAHDAPQSALFELLNANIALEFKYLPMYFNDKTYIICCLTKLHHKLFS